MLNKLAVITGAASGIGLSLTKACIQKNMDVVMVDVDKDALNHQVDSLKAVATTNIVPMLCDVASYDEMLDLAKKIIHHFKRVDLLINNAGISGSIAPIWDISIENMRQVLDINMYGVLHGIKAFLPYLFEQEHESHIVNMASLYGLCSGANMAAYTMSKHALIALSESLYFDLKNAKKTIHVSVACPSFTNTQLLMGASPENAQLQSVLHRIMKYSQSAEDVAHIIMQEIEHKTFYIFPDNEVKNYSQQRQQAMIQSSSPYEHNVEKILKSLFSL